MEYLESKSSSIWCLIGVEILQYSLTGRTRFASWSGVTKGAKIQRKVNTYLGVEVGDEVGGEVGVEVGGVVGGEVGVEAGGEVGGEVGRCRDLGESSRC